ncbi:fructosamine kinase family protein [Halomarina rubra]|uniref:Fructosamine kinase family protein n=1 Tax=Halomarina rubra TaxID=2071873 RepID=A0ABD6AW33_9EURY|nr:fructosamine kinase family protein [Halomarina rubra]
MVEGPTDADEPQTWRDELEAALEGRVVAVAPLDGGVTGRAFRVDLADGRRVVAKTAPTPLTVEARMLRYLATHSSLPLPDVRYASDDLLVLAFVPGDDPVTPAVERDLADHLAALHDETTDACGFPFDTTAGPLPKPNPWTESWPAFVRDHRLRYYAALAASDAALPAALVERLWRLGDRLPDLLDDPAAPALLHGDVWTQNLVVDGDGVAAFLDPACYYGHPEAEVTYVCWTETAGETFVERYRDRAGLAAGFETRRAVYEVVFYCQQAWWFVDVDRRDDLLVGLRDRLDRLSV